MKPKVGDLVRLKPLVVTEIIVPEGRYSFIHDGGYWFSVTENEIEEIISPPLAIGDRVHSDENTRTGTIKALDDGFAWVRWDLAGFTTVETAKLTRAD